MNKKFITLEKKLGRPGLNHVSSTKMRTPLIFNFLTIK